MNILVYSQYYYPESFRANDICEALVGMGDKVKVVAGTPNYPMGHTFEDYKNGKNRDQNINGVDIHRCPTISRRNNFLFRLLNYLSYPLSSKKYSHKIPPTEDVVLVYQLSPVTMAEAAVERAKKYKKPLVLYCLDIWPESLKTGGITDKSLLYKYYFRKSKNIYKKCDKILITSKSFKKYLIDNFNIDENKIIYLPQHAESIFSPRQCIKKPEEKYEFIFAGNIGKAQHLEVIVEAAEHLRKIKSIHFTILGDGSEINNVKKLIFDKGLDNISILGRKPLNEMPEYYKKADAMLVTLVRDSAVSLTLPGKVQTYMAAGKPIIGAINGEAEKIITEANCGLCGPAENSKVLAENILRFIKEPNKKKYSTNSYDYYKRYFEKNIIMKKLKEFLADEIKEYK